MQKWSPEPFAEAQVETAALAAAGGGTEFASESPVLLSDSDVGTGAHRFRSEAGFADSKSLMNALTAEERGQVYELVEMDLVEEYQEREKRLREEFAAEEARLEAEMTASLAQWTNDLAAIMTREIREVADASARLAVQIAEKLVRQTVAADHTVLARVIETTSFKISENAPLTIQASVEDAEWLAAQPELREKLNIGEVVADRRIESGGCLIRCGGREWDATLTRQLGSLAEIVDEMLATSTNPDQEERLLATLTQTSDQLTPPEPEADNDTGLD